MHCYTGVSTGAELDRASRSIEAMDVAVAWTFTDGKKLRGPPPNDVHSSSKKYKGGRAPPLFLGAFFSIDGTKYQ